MGGPEEGPSFPGEPHGSTRRPSDSWAPKTAKEAPKTLQEALKRARPHEANNIPVPSEKRAFSADSFS
eukprot:399324-Pyramimonas_sp.AAC.1